MSVLYLFQTLRQQMPKTRTGLRIIAILGSYAGLLWISKGFPPAVSTRFFQMLLQFQILLPKLGWQLVLSLAIQALQVLALSLAWTVLVFITWRELQVFLHIWYKAKLSSNRKGCNLSVPLQRIALWKTEQALFEEMQLNVVAYKPARNAPELYNILQKTSYPVQEFSLLERDEMEQEQLIPLASCVGEKKNINEQICQVLTCELPFLEFVGADLLETVPQTLRVHAASHTGLVRAYKPNEDAFLHYTTQREVSSQSTLLAGLYLVADGMGGHEQGRYASSTIVETIRSVLLGDLNNPFVQSEDLCENLITSVQLSNRLLVRENKASGALCGTTLTGAALLEQAGPSPRYIAHVVNVGDSRTYRYSPSTGFVRITRDHSIVEDLIASGDLSPEERYTSKRRNEIYRCLGDREDLEIDIFTLSLTSSDRLLICSDGLWEMVHDDALERYLTTTTDDPAVITSLLINAALAAGGSDNVTALVVLL